MNRTKKKLNRNAIAALLLALVWMFLLPVQAFAQEDAEVIPEGDSAAVVSTEGESVEGTQSEVAETEDAGSEVVVSEDAGTEPAPAEEKKESESSENAEPTGTAYLAPDISDSSEEGSEEAAGEDWKRYDNTDSDNAIQQAVDAAIAAGQNYITVVVQSGAYTGGLNIDNSGVDENGNAKESIVVNIIAHDAYEVAQEDLADGETSAEDLYPVPTNSDGTVDTSAINSGSAGGVKLEGGVNVKNVELILAGIYLTMKEQKENQGKIESLFTEEGNVDINVEGSDSFTYYGTAEGDSVNFNLTDVKDTTLDTGDGDDVIDITTTTSANVELDMNNKDDAEHAEEFGNAASADSVIHISTGNGNDKITVTQNSTVTHEKKVVSVRKGENRIAIHAGDGADTITLKGGTGLLDIKKDVSEEIANRVYAIVSANLPGHGSSVVVDGGADDDLLNLDTTWELGTLGKSDVDYRGGDGKNRLHLTGGLAPVDGRVSGYLNEDGSGNICMYIMNSLSRTDYSVIDKNLWLNKTVTELELQSPNAMVILMSGVSAVTDDLAGKETVEVTIENGKVMEGDKEAAFRPFTDYVYEPDDDAVNLESFANYSAGGMLTKLIISGQNLTIGNGVQILLPGITVMLETENNSYSGGSIVIEGYLEAENIMLKLTSTDSRGISFVEFDEENDIGMDPSIMDVDTTATVTIAATAKLIASQVVDILAKTIQSNGLLPDLTDLIPGLGTLVEQEKIDGYIEKIFGFKSLEMLQQASSINFVSVKMATAVIDILGSIVAGSVRVNANSEVDSSASNSVLRDLGLPFALSVILGEAGIKVSNNASITANAGDIYLDAQSSIKVNTTALSGRLPFTVAISVIDNEAYVDISGGTLKSTNGSIIANATGTVNMKTDASGSNVRPNNNAVVPSTDNQASNTTTQLEMGKSGGFFAISVLNQDVFAALRGSANAYASGDVSVNSTAKASVVNNASSNPGEDGESMTLVKLLKTLAGDEEVDGNGGYVGKIINKLTSHFNGKKNQTQSEEEKAKIEESEKKKTSALSKFLDKLTGNGDDSEGDDVGSLVDKATSSANTGKTDSTNSVQLVGSLAVTYADNNNKAYIETDGEVCADGTLAVNANGELKVETLADGSPVSADDPAGGDEKTGPQDQHYAAHNHGVVKVDKLTNGTIIMDASVGKNEDGTYQVTENNNFPKGIDAYDTFNFVVKACFGYKLKADENGRYWVTNDYKRDSDNSKQSEQIEVELIGKDSDGCYIYKSVNSGYGGVRVNNAENVFKAEFIPKQSITVNNNAPTLGSVEVTDAQKDGKTLYFADQGEDVYVKVNIKSGVTDVIAPNVTYKVEGSETVQPVTVTTIIKGDAQEDGTHDYYYGFKMPEGDVTIQVMLNGENMNIKLDLTDTAQRTSDVWITDAQNDPSGDAMEADAVYAGKVGDKIKIVIQLAQNTFLVQNSLMFAGQTPVYIKDITYDGENQYTCYVNIPAILKTEGDAAAGSDLKLTFQTTLDPKEAQGTVEDTSTALGAGLAVDVTRYNNQAYITKTKDNTVSAGSIEVKANTAELSASATSKAGFVAGDLGVAGAITVHLVSVNNEALIGGEIVAIELNGGNLVVDSVIQNSAIVTNAEAAGDGADGKDIDPDSVGVGAGIAVGVSNLAVVSRILDSVTISGTIGDLNINAGHTGSESMKASAGASGGTSAVPVLALNISGVSVLADSGKMLGNVLNLTGNALINAANSITRTITADAAAVGGGVGVGASFIIDILNDSAKAKLARSVKGNGNVTVSADAISRLNATAKSGAKGSVSEDAGNAGSGDGGNDSGASGDEPPPSGGSDNKVDLPDDYYEGLDNLFGEGSTDNELEEDDDPESLAPLFKEGEADKFVDSNKQSAQDLSNLVANNNGNVNSQNVGNAFENRQKAETSEGSVQVAATMVLNIQVNTALAQIDEVEFIKADGTVSVTSRHDTDGVIMADASATNSTTGVGVAVAINTVTYTNVAEILTNSITAGGVVVRANVYEGKTEEAAEGFFEAIKKDVLDTVDGVKNFIGSVREAAGKDALDSFIRSYLADRAITYSKELENGILQLIVQWVGELLQGKTPSFPTTEQENKIQGEVTDFAKDQVTNLAKIIFKKVKVDFSFKKLKEMLIGKEGLYGSLKKKIKNINVRQKATDAVVHYLAGKLGGNEEVEAVGPRISTSAASGAGATNVGVAGSVAISVVNGTSNAFIADADNGNLTVDGNITVESKASQDVYTSAGASVDALGRVEKNKDATDNANATQGGNANADSGKSVGVGAAVAMSFADLTSDAGIGSGWTISAQDLLMDSQAENNVETTSVSGTDPLARTEAPSDKAPETPDKKEEEDKKTEEEKKEEEEENAAKAMDYAVDASVSVTLIQNTVKAYLAEYSVITLSGNLNMLSSQAGETNTNASGFAMGNETAVGAAVAINLAFSDVATQLLGSGTVVGTASLDSRTENQDDANALALAMGAEMDRYVAKLRNSEKVMAYNKKKEEEKKEEDKKEEEDKKDESSENGEDKKEEDKKDGKIENQTANKVSSQLKRASKVSGKEEQDKSDPSQPLSVQAIKSQNVKTESTNQTNAATNNSVGSTVTDATNANTGNAVSGTLNDQAQEGQSIHVAASVAVNVTEHSAKTEIKGNLTVGGMKAEVENTGNFSTASTGAAISEATNSNCVGAAVSVSVNGNKALIEIPDGISIVVTGTPAAEDEKNANPIMGNVALSTVLNQNSTGDALGRYGVLAISGSSSGKGGKVGLAGSVAVLVAKGTSAILLGDNVSITGENTGSVSIEASDKSKLSAAAMAATKSGGAAAGVGASFALLYAQNEVIAQAGDNFTVTADAFTMTATKHVVDITDFSPDVSVSDFISVLEVNSKGEGGYKVDDADKYGMIVLQKNQNGSYTVFTNLDTGNILDLIQLTSVLASVNYYASAVAGTVMERKGDTSNQKAAVAGAVSMLFNDSVTRASIGSNANISTTGEATINASSETNTRLLGGVLSSSGAKAGIGLNVATAVQNDKVYATVGDAPVIAAGSFHLGSESISDMLVITAAAVNASGTSVGGALNVVINDTGAKSEIGNDATISASDFVEILSNAKANVVLGSVTVSISGSQNKGASVGAIVSVTTNGSAALATMGDRAHVTSGAYITITAMNREQVISVLAAAARSGNGGAGAGTLSVLTTDGKAVTGVGNGAKLTTVNDVTVSAMSDAKLIDVMLAAAASTDAPAVGATIMVNVFNRETGAYIGDNSEIISKLGNVLVNADSDEAAIIISVAGAAASQNAISGNIQVNVGSSKTYATVGDNSTIKAWDSIGITANLDSTVVAISPTVSIGSGSTAVGATVQTNILSNEVKAVIGQNANLIAYAQPSATNGVQTANRETKRKGVILSALSKDLVVAGGVSAGAGKNAVSGVVETMVNKIVVLAKLGANAVVKSGFQTGDTADAAFSGSTPSEQEGELSAEADAHSTLVLFGGAFSASSSTGVGATVLTLVYDKTVDAQILLSTVVPSEVTGNVNITAKTEDLVALVSVNFGVSTSSAANVGGNVLIFQNKVNAELVGNLTAGGNVTVQADSITDMINAVASVSGGLGGTAASGAALITYFQGSTVASVGADSTINCADLTVLATSTANIDSDGVGLTASTGGAAVSGLVNIIVTSSVTKAFIGERAAVKAQDITVIATDNYDLLAVAVSLSGGSNGIGVTAVVTVAKNTVLAYIGDYATVQSASVNVQAVSNRNIRNYAGSVSVGSSAGAGVTVMVAVIGGMLDQDSANGISKGFNPDAFMSGIRSSVPNAAKGYLDTVTLSDDLAADDAKASDLNVGDQNGNYNGTDDYRSDDFDKEYASGTNPGENLSDDVTNTEGSELGMQKPEGEYRNVINAYIGSGCVLTVSGATRIEANEKLNVDIITASASVGGSAGVNVGVAVVVAYSNVMAEVRHGALLNCADITVHAVSGGDGSIAEDQASDVLGAAGLDVNSKGSSIRVIAITIGIGGTAGVSPSVAVLNMASGVVARMDGASGNARVITVKAETLYPQVLAVTGSIGAGGSAGVSASVAVVTFNSDTYAGIVNSELSAAEFNILSNVDNTASAYAMSLAGGAVGVNGGVAVVTNRSTTNTVLDNGVYTISGNVNVKAAVNTNAESFIVGFAVGGVALGLNAAVVNQHATVLTRILGDGKNTLVSRGHVTVSNETTATVRTSVITVVGGGVGVGGNVLLVFNNMEATAAIINMPFKVSGNVTVNAGMNANSEAILASATVGGVAVGLSTSYVGLNAKNLAYLLLPDGSSAEAASIRIYAGTAKNQNGFQASASTVAGGAGAVNVGLNAAVADIHATNDAKILSKGHIVGSVDVQANSAAAALAEIYFASAGGVNVSSATAVSLLRIRQTAEADIASINNFPAFNVSAMLNDNKSVIPSHAKLVTVSGGVYNASANVAVAYSLGQSIARVILNRGTNGGDITVDAGGSSDAKSETLNQSVGVFSGSVYVNVAYASGEFQGTLEVLDYVNARNVKIQNIYSANSHADLTPSALGKNMSFVGFNVNLAIARTAAKALAALAGAGKMDLFVDLVVIADGSNTGALANINGATVNVSGYSFAVNVSDSQMALEQTVSIRDIEVYAENSISVTSKANNLTSTAQTGSNYGVGISLVGGNVDSASADVIAVNQIVLEKASLYAAEFVNTKAMSDGLAVKAIAKALTAQLSGISSAVTVTDATVTKFNTGVILNDGVLYGGSVETSAAAKGTQVLAQSNVPMFSGSLLGLDNIIATATIVEKLTQVIISDGNVESYMYGVVLSADADATLKAGTPTIAVSAGIITVKDYQFNILVNKVLTEVLFDGKMTSAGDAKLTAHDSISGDLKMDDTTVGGFTGANSMAKINIKDQTSQVKITGKIYAEGNILVEAKADQKFSAVVDSESVNIIDNGFAQTDIIVYRNAIVVIDGELISRYGNIDVRAQLDSRADNEYVIYIDQDILLDTWYDDSTYPRATGQLVSVATVTVVEGSLIQAVNVFDNSGTITIVAKSEGRVLVDVYRYVDKPFGNNETYAVADVSETVQTYISGSTKTRIHGRNVNISALMEMDVRSISHSNGNSLAGFYHPNATIIFCSDLDTIIKCADISAQNILNISAYVPYTYIFANSISMKVWEVCKNNPTVTIKGTIYGDVTFDNDTILRANELNVKAFQPADRNNQVKIVRLAEKYHGSKLDETKENTVFDTTDPTTLAKFRTNGWTEFSVEKKFRPGDYDSSTNVMYYSGKLTWSTASNSGSATPSGMTEIYLGSGATGIYIDIDKYAGVKVHGLNSSVNQSDLIYSKDNVFHVDGSKLQNTVSQGSYSFMFDTVPNDRALYQKANNCVLTVVNSSRYSVQLDNFNQSEDSAAKSTSLNVTNRNKLANLIFNGGGKLSNGDVIVNLAGGNLILKNGAVLKAKSIFVEGANALIDEGRTNGVFEITLVPNNGKSFATPEIRISALADLKLLILSEHNLASASNYSCPIESIISNGNILLEVMPLNTAQMDVSVGTIRGNGNVTIYVYGNLSRMGDYDANIVGDNIVIQADGAIGKSHSIKIDSKSSVSAEAREYIILTEVSGDMIIDRIVSTRNRYISLTTNDGSILNHEKDDDQVKELDRLMSKAQELQKLASNVNDKIEVLREYLQVMKDLVQKMAGATAENEQTLLNKGRSEIDILHDAESVEEALEILDINIQITEDEIAMLDMEYLTLIMESVDYVFQASELKKQIEADGIVTSGEVMLYVNSASGEASIGTLDNLLGISGGGKDKLKIAGGVGTELNVVALEFFDNMYLDRIVADTIVIYTLGNVLRGSGVDKTLLEARDLTIRSPMGGDLGTYSKHLELKVDRINLFGENIYVKNEKSLVVDSIFAMRELSLKVSGNLDYIDSDNVMKGISASAMLLRVSGNIGMNTQKPEQTNARIMFAAFRNTQKGFLFNVDGEIDMTAQNACLEFAKTAIISSIYADGDLTINSDGALLMADSTGAIYCDNLNANAYGRTGTEGMPLKVYVRESATTDSYLYGEDVLVIPIVDGKEIPEVRVSGGIAPGAVVTVDTDPAHAACVGCEYLTMRALKERLTYVHIHAEGETDGMIQVEIAVEDMEDGTEVIVLTCRDGVIYAIRAEVRNGYITFLTEELGAFLVLGEASELNLTEDEKFLLTEDSEQALPFGGWL